MSQFYFVIKLLIERHIDTMKHISTKEQPGNQLDDSCTEVVEEIVDSFNTEKTSNSGDSPAATKNVKSSADILEPSEKDPKASIAASFQGREMVSDQLYCLVTGHSHSSLVEFGLTICPRCTQNINSLENDNLRAVDHRGKAVSLSQVQEPKLVDGITQVVERLDKLNEEVKWVTDMIREEEGESDNEDGSEGKRVEKRQTRDGNEGEDLPKAMDKEGSEGNSKNSKKDGEEDLEDSKEDGFTYQVEFRDSQNKLLERQRWKTLFNLVDVSKGAAINAGRTIARITTVMKTNHSGDNERSEREKKKIVKAGFLNNPRVEIQSVKQYMSLESRAIIEVLKKVVKYYPSINLTKQGLVLESPFCLLVHHMDELEAFIASYNPAPPEDRDPDGSTAAHRVEDTGACSEVAFRHIGKILGFLKDNTFGHKLQEEQARHLQDPPVCTFLMLWLLYKPGATVYVNSSGMVEACIVESFEVENSLLHAGDISLYAPQPCTLKLWHLSFDGMHIRRSSRWEIIGAFDGERPILDLKAVPARFADKADNGKTREQLLQYGRKWYSLIRGAQQQHYLGETVGLPKRQVSTYFPIRPGNIYIDFSAA